MSQKRRIAALEAEIDELRDRIAQLEAAPRVTQVFRYEPQPQQQWWHPYQLPQVWCDTTTQIGAGL